MLDQAVDEVSHSTVSRDGEVQVQWDDLPGALALLQEVCSCNPVTCPAEVINCSGILRGKVLVSAPAVLWTQLSTLTRMIAFQVGEYDLVVAMGTKLLEKWESRGFRRDILLSMALAQCGLAADTFAVQQASCTKVVSLTSAVQAYNNTGSTLCQTGAGSSACGITVNNGSMLLLLLHQVPIVTTIYSKSLPTYFMLCIAYHKHICKPCKALLYTASEETTAITCASKHFSWRMHNMIRLYWIHGKTSLFSSQPRCCSSTGVCWLCAYGGSLAAAQ